MGYFNNKREVFNIIKKMSMLRDEDSITVSELKNLHELISNTLTDFDEYNLYDEECKAYEERGSEVLKETKDLFIDEDLEDLDDYYEEDGIGYTSEVINMSSVINCVLNKVKVFPSKEYKMAFIDKLTEAIDTVIETKTSMGFYVESVNIQGKPIQKSGVISFFKDVGVKVQIGDDIVDFEEGVTDRSIIHEVQAPKQEEKQSKHLVNYKIVPDTTYWMKNINKEETDKEKLDILYSLVVDSEEDKYIKINNLMTYIEELLEQHVKLNDKEAELVRFFFEHHPYNEEDMATVSHRALELAWAFRHMHKRK